MSGIQQRGIALSAGGQNKLRPLRVSAGIEIDKRKQIYIFKVTNFTDLQTQM